MQSFREDILTKSYLQSSGLQGMGEKEPLL